MSSQAERIKAFKLAQHARLQKQDEEEQWISSEELCTEGSSDEETHVNSTKTSHRKQKRNPRTEKRGISPLAQPPKAECESTSSYQRDSKYLLPDAAQASGMAVEKPSAPGLDNPDILKLKAECSDLNLADTKAEKPEGSSQAQTSKTCTSSLESETDEDAEIEKMIQWRPKRGSIKLPDFPEEKPATLEHVIFEADMFYSEMVVRVNFLKRKPVKGNYLFSIAENSSCESESFIPSLGKRKKDPMVSNLLKKISKLDAEILEKNVVFESIKKERMSVQEEMCYVISESDLSHCKSSQLFLHLCRFENNDSGNDDKDNDEDNYKSSDQQVKKQKKIEKGVKNFVTRNIELAKQHSMAQFSLTDEEKIKLESLLSDLDSEEYSVEHLETILSENEPKSSQKQIKKELCANNMLDEDEDEAINHFKLKKEEMYNMEDLDVKLHEILKSYEEEDRKIKQALLTISNNEDILESADSRGRYWKQHQLQKRLENIEKDLAGIAAKDAEELKNLQKKNQQCFEDLMQEVTTENKESVEKE